MHVPGPSVSQASPDEMKTIHSSRTSDNLAFFFLALLFGFQGTCTCQDGGEFTVDIGRVLISTSAQTNWIWFNDGPTEASYSLSSPEAPFRSLGGAQNGILGPGQFAVFTFDYDAPATTAPIGAPSVGVNQDLRLTVIPDTTAPDASYTAAVHLKASLTGPVPINVTKKEDSFKEYAADLLSTASHDGPWDAGRYLFTRVTWASSTGKLHDLDAHGIRVREVIDWAGSLPLAIDPQNPTMVSEPFPWSLTYKPMHWFIG